MRIVGHAPLLFGYAENVLVHLGIFVHIVSDGNGVVPCRQVWDGHGDGPGMRGNNNVLQRGRPAYVRAVRARVETLGLGPVVSFLGYTSEKEMRELVLDAWRMAVPKSLASTFKE